MLKKLFKRAVVAILEAEALATLKKYKPKIVAITGSVGKTSTKDAVNTALSRFYSTRSSQKSFNSEIGLPLTILNLPNAKNTTSVIEWGRNIIGGLTLLLLPHYYPEWLVLEIGADNPGDIEKISRWLKPDIVVVTQLSKVPVHVEFFDSPEDLFREKGNLVRALKKGGALILNGDDEDVLDYKNLTQEKTLLFGESETVDVRAIDYKIVYGENSLPKGISFEVSSQGLALPVSLLGAVGKHCVYHISAAMAVCRALGKPLEMAIKGFKHYDPAPGRLRLVEGVNQSVILDDSYNSSPKALEEALATLKNLRKPKIRRRVAVLGDMMELGKYSVDEHKKAGKAVGKVADMLVTVGVRSKYVAEEAAQVGLGVENIFQFNTALEAGEFLKDKIQSKDAVLIKGSQSMRMERVVERIMLHPEEKRKLLVRQDEEWRGRK